MRHRIALAIAFALVLGTAAIARQLGESREIEGTPCALKGPVAPVFFEQTLSLVYTCVDDRVFIRPMYTYAAGPTPQPIPATVTCPGSGHPACALLPPGTYGKDWADTVSR